MSERPLLVVDDDDSTCRYLASLLSSLGYPVQCVQTAELALERLKVGVPPAAILLDLILPDASGLDVLDAIKRTLPAVPVIVLSTVAQISTVVDAIRRGAADYLTKPFEQADLEAAIQNVLENQEVSPDVTIVRPRLDRGDGGFVSASPHIRRIKEIGRQVADTDAPVLVLGESGVGKEVVARYIHAQSRRRSQPFVKVNCAALPDDLLESELFGYEPGAFSGATRLKPGLFELADGGSILLDEIGEMTVSLQAKLLHVLQDGEFTRLGGRRQIKVDARVMASTNVRLEEAVAAGRFREDLYFRLNVIRLEVPPLKDRREDIPLLCAHFLRTYAARYNRPARELPRDLRDAFQRHDWPGNVRELENAVRRYVILADLEASLAELSRNPAPAEGASTHDERPRTTTGRAASHEDDEARSTESLSLRTVGAQAAEEAERKLLARVLAATRWNRKEAASQLKISYKALLNKLKKWDVEDLRLHDDELPAASGKRYAHQIRAVRSPKRTNDPGPRAAAVPDRERPAPNNQEAVGEPRPWPRRVTR
jgi:two-component system, NtrC family, response regulator AtoC